MATRKVTVTIPEETLERAGPLADRAGSFSALVTAGLERMIDAASIDDLGVELVGLFGAPGLEDEARAAQAWERIKGRARGKGHAA